MIAGARTIRQEAGVLSDVASRLRQAVRDLRELVVQLEQTSAWASVKSTNLLRALAAEDGA